MPLGVDTNVNVKELVVSSTLFGPKEVQQIKDSIAADFSNYRSLREAVQELESVPAQIPRVRGQAGRLLFPAGPIPAG